MRPGPGLPVPFDGRRTQHDEAGGRVDTDIAVEVVLDDAPHVGPGRSSVLTLVWREDEPFAVQLYLRAQPDHPALARGEWRVLRDFLLYGLEVPTGDGDVRITPDEGRDRVVLRLRRDGRPALLSLPRPTVRAFLTLTEQCVPCGEERSDSAVDALLDRLFSAEDGLA